MCKNFWSEVYICIVMVWKASYIYMMDVGSMDNFNLSPADHDCQAFSNSLEPD